MTKDVLTMALEALDSKYIVGCGEWRKQQLTAINAIKKALARPTSGDYALGYAEGFNDACKKPAQQEPEMPYTVMGGELDCSHAEELCKKLTETKGCWHTVIGTGQLKQDGSPAAWGCVMCGTSFAPKMSEKSLADLYQIGFSNGRKSAEILSPKKHPQPAQPQQEPNLAEAFRTELDKLSQRNYELRMENAQLKSQPHPWVGLTDEEVVNCWPGIMLHPDCAEFWKNIEAKLKAKNEL